MEEKLYLTWEPKMEGKKFSSLTVRLDDETLEQLQQISDATNLTRGEIVRRMIRFGIGRCKVVGVEEDASG